VNNNSRRADTTIFITGIPASGKSTLGKRLEEDLLKNGIENVKLLDGEEIRASLAKRGKHYGYSTDERNAVALEIAHIASEYSRKGIICIVCSICHLREIRQKMRKIMGNVMEVYLDCPVSVCARRDYKGHYAKAFRGLYENFIGVTEPYQESGHVQAVLHTGIDSIEKCSKDLLESVIAFLSVEEGDVEKHYIKS